jgi:hypothetical protein
MAFFTLSPHPCTLQLYSVALVVLSTYNLLRELFRYQGEIRSSKSMHKQYNGHNKNNDSAKSSHTQNQRLIQVLMKG